MLHRSRMAVQDGTWTLAGLVTIIMAVGASAATTGRIAADKTPLYAGGASSYYVVGHLDQGAPVQVDSVVFEWHKITPPAGTFSFIEKAAVEAAADGKSGLVKRDGAEVKAAALTGPLDSYRRQCELKKGDTVQIAGTDGDWYKIAPPKGAFVYLAPNALIAVAPPTGGAGATGGATAVVAPPATQPAGTAGGAVMAVAPPATQPTGAVLVAPPARSAALAAAEERFQAALKLPLEQQPIAELAAAYQEILAETSLLPSERQVATLRAAQLRRNAELAAAVQDLARLRQKLEAAATQPAGLTPAKSTPEYDAVGQLVSSAVYDGTRLPRLYRLVEPATLRTIAYVEPAGVDAATCLGRVVGVIGQGKEDPHLRLPVITIKQMDILRPATP